MLLFGIIVLQAFLLALDIALMVWTGVTPIVAASAVFIAILLVMSVINYIKAA